MPTYTGGNGAFTPSTSQDNYTVDSQSAGVFGKVISIGWGGSGTSSVGYRTRWTRPTTIGSGAFTSLVPAYHQPNYTTFGSRIGTFATVPVLGADPGANLWANDWNVQGGVGLITLPLANPWFFVNGVLTGQVSCRNTKGTDASLSSYEATVEE
jgi:hypothetical protein